MDWKLIGVTVLPIFRLDCRDFFLARESSIRLVQRMHADAKTRPR